MTEMNFKKPVLLGTIGRAQGTSGAVRVKSYTQKSTSLGDYGVLFSRDGRPFEVLDIHTHKTTVIVHFLGINDRNAAEQLNGTDLFIEREHLPDDELTENEFFYTDLEGLAIFDEKGKSWGTVKALFDFGGGDLIEVCRKGQKSVMIPFTQHAVPTVNIEDGHIIINPVAAGLVK